MVYPGSTGVAPRAGMVLAPQFGQNTAVAGTSMRQRGQLVVDSSTSPATYLHYPSQADIERVGVSCYWAHGSHRSRNKASRRRSQANSDATSTRTSSTRHRRQPDLRRRRRSGSTNRHHGSPPRSTPGSRVPSGPRAQRPRINGAPRSPRRTPKGCLSPTTRRRRAPSLIRNPRLLGGSSRNLRHLTAGGASRSARRELLGPPAGSSCVCVRETTRTGAITRRKKLARPGAMRPCRWAPARDRQWARCDGADTGAWPSADGRMALGDRTAASRIAGARLASTGRPSPTVRRSRREVGLVAGGTSSGSSTIRTQRHAGDQRPARARRVHANATDRRPGAARSARPLPGPPSGDGGGRCRVQCRRTRRRSVDRRRDRSRSLLPSEHSAIDVGMRVPRRRSTSPT